ncbi:MAG TPA: YcaO-like family protein [Microlunatus sp.]|nr:YcaO-like family protein [Microlunatus sp.]
MGNPFIEDPASGAGTSLDEEEACARALGEGLERYCGLSWTTELVQETLVGAGLFGRWARCAAREDAPDSLKALPADVPIWSVPARNAADGSRVLVPAAHVILGYEPPPEEPLVTVPISTGLAFHPDPVRAIWSGLCEVVERDAVMSAWWIHHDRPEITSNGAPHAVVERLERLDDRGMTARLFDVTTEVGIPTVFSVLTSPRYPHLVVGAATKADATEACTKALDEVVSMRLALSHRDRPPMPTSQGAVAAPETLVDHAAFYAVDADHPGVRFLRGDEQVGFAEFSRQSVPAPTTMRMLRDSAVDLGRRGLTVLWVDITVPEVQPFGCAVKVIVPELVPLSPTHRIRWLGTDILIERAGRVPGFSGFTPHPHPFA